MTEEFDFGFSTVDTLEVSKAVSDDRLNRIWKLIVPFLDNLSKDPEKDIHWPNRDVKIKEFKQKLQRIVEE